MDEDEIARANQTGYASFPFGFEGHMEAERLPDGRWKCVPWSWGSARSPLVYNTLEACVDAFRPRGPFPLFKEE